MSPACDFCYAETWGKRSGRHKEWKEDAPRRRTSESNWREPLAWDRDAREAGRIDTVFSISLGDIWDNKVPSEWREAFFDEVVSATPNLLWLLLSKRIGNAVAMCEGIAMPSNIALGATIVEQKEWDRDIPKLRFAAVNLRPQFTFVSVEPMIEPITMTGQMPGWVICGGETGSAKARTMDLAWARSLRDQCRARDVPFFMKQLGSKSGIRGVTGHGEEPLEWPADLRVREHVSLERRAA